MARGPIRGFSRASRLRLLWLIAQVGVDAFKQALFLTLTYPAGDPVASSHKRHLDALLKRLARAHPEAVALWKLEYTEAGTPHFHLILFKVGFWHFKEVAQAWAAIVKSEHPAHVQAGVRIEKLLSKRHAARYLAKYVSKWSTYPQDHRGRVWGKVGSISALFSEKVMFVLSKVDMYRVRRTLDLIRKSLKRTRKFRRATNVGHSQRWFLGGSTVVRLLEAWKVPRLSFEPG